ncbi:AraC family transcriptional regulator [Lutispora thermophila DSM 19022]|uniref:AraC family transcriptional regulator n=1 Tax=Lutispora thermophila DSM 19022 TaxID=1122184 RepID=A0A1M6D257_9FIRM|nr:AraC family transcriptional regulator [Lutispora thermophila DSM 19022]
MIGWIEGIQNAIEYIEENLTEELNIKDIAEKACVSAFHFQRIFNVLCGFTVGEYIRCRRLSIAAEELSKSDVKVIDVAIKYGYDSPDSFTRAFTKFHGVSPSAAKLKGAKLKSLAPIRIKLTLEGGTMLEYKIVEKAQFTVMGKIRNFNIDTSYDEIPKFWQEHNENEDRIVCGMYGICMDSDGIRMDYMIADNYLPWNEIPDGYETRVFPAGTWAVFPCRGELPKSLQDINTKIWSEWLPSCKEYKLAGNYNIEMYTPPCDNPDDYYCEIWIPVERV